MRGAVAIILLAIAARPLAGQQPRGHLFIVGGGEAAPELPARFVELAGGAGARIAVLPMASGEPDATGAEKVEELVALGADAFVLTLSRSEAEDSGTVARLAGVTGVWFTGGDQVPLAAALLGTPVHRALVAMYRRGGVIGGTSAGAAVMTDSMLTGNQRRPDSLGYYGDEYPRIAAGYIEVVPGLGFLHGAVVDQHFIRRERANRLLSVILERPTLVGAGIDEGTALEVDPDGKWRVFGGTGVLIIDARQARVRGGADGAIGASEVRVALLPPGSVFDPRTGKAGLSVAR